MASDDILTSDALDRHVFDAGEETQRLRRALHEQSERMVGLTEEAARLQRTLDEQSAHVDLLNTRMAFLTEHRDGLRGLMVAHHERLLERDTALRRARARLADVEAEAQRRHELIVRLEEDVRTVAAENQQRGVYIEHLTGHLAAVESESLARRVYIEHLETEWSKLRVRLTEIETERAQHQEHIQHLDHHTQQMSVAFAAERAWLQERIAALESAAQQGGWTGRLRQIARAIRRKARRMGFIR